MTTKQKKVKLPNDYERMIPEYHKGTSTYAEHIVRYEAAAELVRGKVVLDIASGSGYGSASLARSAKRVIGVEVDPAAVAYSEQNYSSKNTEYRIGDGVSIPLDDNSVDVVVSFETIEHIKDYEGFVREVKRVLRPDGLLVLSTPNDKEFAEGNHFHLHEFEYDELKNLVKRYFKNISAYFQSTWVAAALTDEAGFSKEWRGPVDTLQLAPIKHDQALYFYLLCSNRPVTEELQPLSSFGEHYSARRLQQEEMATATKLHELAEYGEYLAEQVHDGQAAIAGLQAQLDAATLQLSAITNSRRWKILEKASKGKHKLKRIIKRK